MDTKGRKVFVDCNDSSIIRVNVDNSMTDSSSNLQRAERQAKLQKILKKNSRLRFTTMTKIHYPYSLLSSNSASNVKSNKLKTVSNQENSISNIPRRPTRRVTKENVRKYFEMKLICSRPTVAIKTTEKLENQCPIQPINILVSNKPSVEAPSLEKAVEKIVNWREESRLLPKSDEHKVNPGMYVPPMMRLRKVNDVVIETIPIEEQNKPIKEQIIPIKEHIISIKEHFIPIKEQIKLIKEQIKSNKEQINPIKEQIIPNKEQIIPNKEQIKPNNEQIKPFEQPFKPSSKNSTLRLPQTKTFSEKKPITNASKTAAIVQKMYNNKNKWTANSTAQHSYNNKINKFPTTQAQDRLLTVQKSISDDDSQSSNSESKSMAVRSLKLCLQNLQIAEDLKIPKEEMMKTSMYNRLRIAPLEECPKATPLRRPYMKPQ